MKYAILALSALLTLGCATADKGTLPSVSLVMTPHARGSATPVFRIDGKTFFITAKHVVDTLADGFDEETLKEDEEELLHSTVAGKPIIDLVLHPDLDVALISARVGPIACAQLAIRMPDYPSKVYSIGWHLGQHLLLTEGRASPDLGVMSAPVIHGASGGAVLDARLCYVGVISQVAYVRTSPFSASPVPHVALYVPLSAFRDWLMEQRGKAR